LFPTHDEGPTVKERLLTALYVLLGLVILVPLALFLAAWFYLSALLGACRVLVEMAVRRPASADPGVQEPHIIQARLPVNRPSGE
jgi:hypothetical protein